MHHPRPAEQDRRWLAAALAVNLAFAGGEALAGLLAGSLALLSDAAHMLTDGLAIGLALAALEIARRPAGGNFTFGLARSEILSAQLNGALLCMLALGLGVPALLRLAQPEPIDGGVVLIAGLVGALANGLAAWLLARAGRQSLNVRGAWLHTVMDLLASLGAALAGAVVLAGGPVRIDAAVALLVCLLMLRSGWALLRDSGRILLEAAPDELDPQEIGYALARHPGVLEVHDLHLWTVTSGFPALAAHVLAEAGQDCAALRLQLAELLTERYGISHSTLQVEPGRPRLLQIEG